MVVMFIKKSYFIFIILFLSIIAQASDNVVMIQSPKKPNCRSIDWHIKVFKQDNGITLTSTQEEDLSKLMDRFEQYYSLSNDRQEMIEHIIDQIVQFKKFYDHGWHSDDTSLLNFFVGPVQPRKHNLSPSEEEVNEFNKYVIASAGASPIRLSSSD